jgi:hypothetical protein
MTSTSRAVVARRSSSQQACGTARRRAEAAAALAADKAPRLAALDVDFARQAAEGSPSTGRHSAATKPKRAVAYVVMVRWRLP